jgi:hypothetical protein
MSALKSGAAVAAGTGASAGGEGDGPAFAALRAAAMKSAASATAITRLAKVPSLLGRMHGGCRATSKAVVSISIIGALRLVHQVRS